MMWDWFVITEGLGFRVISAEEWAELPDEKKWRAAPVTETLLRAAGWPIPGQVESDA